MESFKFISAQSIYLFLAIFLLSSFPSPSVARRVVKPVKTDQNQNQTGGLLQTYIVHVQHTSSTAAAAAVSTDDEREEWYMSFLPPKTANEGQAGSSRLLYSYRAVATAFAARLTPDELAQMEKKPGFVQAYPDTLVHPATTRTPEFLGLHRYTAGIWNDTNYGKGVIIGMLDTGISPNHSSFSDGGGMLPPPPAKWKGVCEFNSSDCKNKLIGARNFAQGLSAMQGSPSGTSSGPYDDQGHGTHTASTAGGMFVDNASIDGQANGTAAGVAPYAYLAIYKVCGIYGCASTDILAGLDAAVSDGVDVLSISLGSYSNPFYYDPIAIGTFAAVQKGIFISAAAGNDGPSLSSLSNEAPWILTVGASSVDRSIRTTVKLGSGDEFNGESIYQPGNYTSPNLPLVYLGGSYDAASCLNGSLDGFNVKGMIVFCDHGRYSSASAVEKGSIVKAAGGAGMIIAGSSRSYIPDDVHVLPASHVSYDDGLAIKAYIQAATGPTASISFKGTVLGTSPAPVVASFSSRGPNGADPSILKPDIIGPGVNILAAWPFQVGDLAASPLPAAVPFNIISGTSMSTPHLSGIAALLKSSHPDWSPAAIKSSIMTTADLTANDGNQITDEKMQATNFFAVGSGHVNVVKANKPGLVYDITPDDYVRYLCGLSYTSEQVTTIAGRSIDCSNITAAIGGWQLNYPSFMVNLNATNSYTTVVTRTVTNVGSPNSAYTVKVKTPVGATVKVEPGSLYFAEANEKAQFSVTFTASVSIRGIVSYAEGYLTWISTDNATVVNSPIMVAVG